MRTTERTPTHTHQTHTDGENATQMHSEAPWLSARVPPAVCTATFWAGVEEQVGGKEEETQQTCGQTGRAADVGGSISRGDDKMNTHARSIGKM